MFKFTFSIGSHLFNPFTAQAQNEQQEDTNDAAFRSTATTTTTPSAVSAASSGGSSSQANGVRRLPAPPRRFAVESADDSVDATPILTPLSRKRGWAPSSSSPSASISLAASTNGWLDTPSRYVHVASSAAAGGCTAAAGSDSHSELHDQDFPPAKRRKTIADSILSTALSAALIGTAVGMSAYRMWRDRGISKQPHDPVADETIIDQPPPPYEQEGWVHATMHTESQVKSVPVVPSPQYSSRPASSLPPTPRTPKSLRANKTRRTARIARHRGTATSTPPPLSSPRRVLRSPSKAPSTSTSYFDDQDPQDEFDVQIDSMDDKIRRLIEEGQKALGKEVVVMNDDDRYNEDGAVDDGLDGWEEVDENKNNRLVNHSSSSLRISGDRRKKRRPSNATARGNHFSIPPSTSLPSRLNDHDAFALGERPMSRPRAPTGTSRLGSPVDTSSSSTSAVQVIYEPLGASGNNLGSPSAEQFEFEDQESLNLSQRMEKIRQAYRL